MNYLYTAKENFEDYSSGRVFYNMKGVTSFPARLACEIFYRCKEHLIDKGIVGDYTLFDPCCGGAYLLTTLGFQFGNDIKKIIAFDVDKNAIELAHKNLELLTINGLYKRRGQIEELYNQYKKDSHKYALNSIENLSKFVKEYPIDIICSQRDVFDTQSSEDLVGIDIVLVDVPYGDLVSWSLTATDLPEKFLNNIRKVVSSNSIVAVVSDKKQKFNSPLFKRKEKFNCGLRQVVILESI